MQGRLFVGEAIRPDAATFDSSCMASGEPGLPSVFHWKRRRKTSRPWDRRQRVALEVVDLSSQLPLHFLSAEQRHDLGFRLGRHGSAVAGDVAVTSRWLVESGW